MRACSLVVLLCDRGLRTFWCAIGVCDRSAKVIYECALFVVRSFVLMLLGVSVENNSMNIVGLKT